MKTKKCIAMLLAGGQGSRLGVLTKGVAKPAVQFGSKYKIIDFVLTNCAHSGVDTVGVLTQYKPLLLNTYIGSGKSWDLDRINGGVYVLPPYMQESSGEWYKGTANAIYQNIEFIEQFNPEYVLVLSGDHIYKMNYDEMLRVHEAKNADVTIAYINVPMAEASRFGILEIDGDGKIIEFVEKPKEPKSNCASMGIYIFNWQELRKQLIRDEADKNSSNDFGKNIIPSMLMQGKRMYGFGFHGYWKDVGTVSSLYEANMDLLDSGEINLYDTDWQIFSRNPLKPPHYIDSHAEIKNSYITEGCYIDGKVEHSILSDGVSIGENAQVIDSIILTDCIIGANAVIRKAIIGAGTKIGENVQIGVELDVSPQYNSSYCSNEITLIGENITIDNDVKIGGNCMIATNILKEGK